MPNRLASDDPGPTNIVGTEISTRHDPAFGIAPIMPHAALAPNLREAVSCQRRRAGADSVPSRPRLSSDYRALSRLQAESPGTTERSIRMSILQKSRFVPGPVFAN